MRSWLGASLRIECGRCGKVRMLNEAHASDAQRDMRLRDLLTHARHEGGGGRAVRAELLTVVDGVSSRPARRIVLGAGCVQQDRQANGPSGCELAAKFP